MSTSDLSSFVLPDHYAVLETDTEKLVCYVLDSKLAISLECFIVSRKIFTQGR